MTGCHLVVILYIPTEEADSDGDDDDDDNNGNTVEHGDNRDDVIAVR